MNKTPEKSYLVYNTLSVQRGGNLKSSMLATTMTRQVLLKNGRIWRSSNRELATWMVINPQTGYITNIGDGEAPEAASYDAIDVGGKLILPGFHESHIHVSDLGRVLCGPNLEKCTSIAEALKIIKDFTDTHINATFIVAYNLNDVITGRLPTIEELDEICPDRPVLVYRVCIHIAVVNTCFFKRLGWDETTADPEGGVIEHRPDGTLTGCVKESALTKAELIITWSMEERLEHIKAGLNFCVCHGVTSVHSNEPSMWREYCTLAPQLPIRVFLAAYWRRKGEGNFPEKPHKYSELLSCDRVKLFADGSLGAFTAALTKPYNGTDTKGILLYTQEEFNQMVHEATSLGFRLEMHAIGDAAADMVLSAVKHVDVAPQKRPILTHCQILREDQLKLMKELGIVANIQPQMLVTDCQWLQERVPKDLLTFAYAWKSLKSYGLVCAGGSDAPVEHATPLVGMYDAVFRRLNRQDVSSQQYKPEECCTLSEAIDLYTTGGAWAAMREHDLGKLLPGYKADFVIVDTPDGDLLTSPQLLLSTSISQVWVNAQRNI